MPGITQQSFLPASVEILRVEGLQSDSKPVYAMSEITEDNVQILVRDVIEKLRWLAQYSLTMRR